MTLIIISCIALLVLYIIVWCVLFAKAGKPAGFLFIPFYGAYCMYEIGDSTGLFFASLAVSIFSSVASFMAAKSASALLVLSIISLAAGLIISIIFRVRLARAFGRSGGFAAGLVFLPIIFLCILAFGGSEHYTVTEQRRVDAIRAQREQERAAREQEARLAQESEAESEEKKKKKNGKEGKKDKDKKDKKDGKKKDKKKDKDKKKGKKKKDED